MRSQGTVGNGPGKGGAPKNSPEGGPGGGLLAEGGQTSSSEYKRSGSKQQVSELREPASHRETGTLRFSSVQEVCFLGVITSRNHVKLGSHQLSSVRSWRLPEELHPMTGAVLLREFSEDGASAAGSREEGLSSGVRQLSQGKDGPGAGAAGAAGAARPWSLSPSPEAAHSGGRQGPWTQDHPLVLRPRHPGV